MKSKFVFLESNTTGTGELLIQKAKKMGYLPVFLIKNPDKYSFLPLSDIQTVIIDTENEAVLLKYLYKEENIIGIYSSSDYAIEMVAHLARALNLKGTNPDVINLCRDKYRFYQTLVASEIHVPKTISISTEEELPVCDFPIIVKPVNGTGSVDVKLCKDKKFAIRHIQDLLNNNPSLLIQEYIQGVEFSVEVFSQSSQHHILGITQKHLGELPNFVEIGHDFPAVLTSACEKKIHQAVQKLLIYLNVDFGFFHIELRIREEQVVIIEVNPRLAGGMIPMLIEKATGIDVLESLLEIYSQKTLFFQKEKYKKYASIRHLLPPCSGHIKVLTFQSEVPVDAIKCMKKKGELVCLQGDFRDRIGYVIVSDLSMEACLDKAQKALLSFHLEIEEGCL